MNYKDLQRPSQDEAFFVPVPGVTPVSSEPGRKRGPILEETMHS
jgi:hypothetical protein